MPLLPPPTPAARTFYDWIDAHRDDMVRDLQGVLRIRSVEETQSSDSAPFGAGVRAALDYTLDLCKSYGLDTRDVGPGFAGHAEFGTGGEMVAAVGHLDVVPEGEGWSHPPYAAEVHDGYVYARGASDDKGSTYAALFGALAVRASGLPLNRRVRVIFGCNEESGFRCVHHYWEVAREERPVLAFTPDASFPLIYAEKGIANLVLERDLPTAETALRIEHASGGFRPNMVPEAAEATIVGAPADLLNAAATLRKWWDRNISVEVGATSLRVVANGKSAHGARPTLGDNAIARLAHALLQLDLAEADTWLRFATETVDTTGAALGIDGADDVAGALTNNLGIIEYVDGRRVRLTYNIRYPVTWTFEHLISRAKPVAAAAGWTIADTHDQPPLYVPTDGEPTATLLRVYREATGDTESQPGTMGGGTYARATPHAVAFGASFPGGSDGPAHEPDERIALESYFNAAKIYAVALYEMARSA